jgi:hypothetical protein
MANARHTTIEGLNVKTSRLVVAKTIHVPLNDGTKETAPVNVKVYALPIEDWSNLTRKELSSNLHLFDGQVVSVVRNDREVYTGYLPGMFASSADILHRSLLLDGKTYQIIGVMPQGFEYPRYSDLPFKAPSSDYPPLTTCWYACPALIVTAPFPSGVTPSSA